MAAPTTAQLRRLIRNEINRLVRIVPSTTIHVAPGDHPLQPSVITGGGAGGDVDGPASATDNAVALFDGTTGKLIKDSTIIWDGSTQILGVAGTDVVIQTSFFAGVSGDLRIQTGDSDIQAGEILIQPGVRLGVGNRVGSDVTIRAGQANVNEVGGLTSIVGGTGVSISDGGEVHIDGGFALGSGNVGNVVIQGVIFLPGAAIDASGGLTTDTLADSGAGQVTMGADLDLAGNRLFGNQTVLGVGFDGGGSTIAAGTEIEIRIEQGFIIDAWYIIADQSGDIQIDIWRDTFANHPPTVADTITGGNEPAISSDDKASDLVLTGWDTTVNDGDILKFVVDSALTITRCSIYLVGTRT